MKTNLKQLVVVGASSLLLVGCCTIHHATQWEYKIAQPVGYNAHSQVEIDQAFLNDQAKDGWIFIEKDDQGDFFFKRLKR